jgi:hypothetical protein
MEMEVLDALLRVRAGIDHGPVSGLCHTLLIRYAGSRRRYSGNQLRVFGRGHGEIRHVPAGNHNDVDRRLRIDVPKCQYGIVFVHDLSRNLTGHDPAEEAVRHGSV